MREEPGPGQPALARKRGGEEPGPKVVNIGLIKNSQRTKSPFRIPRKKRRGGAPCKNWGKKKKKFLGRELTRWLVGGGSRATRGLCKDRKKMRKNGQAEKTPSKPNVKESGAGGTSTGGGVWRGQGERTGPGPWEKNSPVGGVFFSHKESKASPKNPGRNKRSDGGGEDRGISFSRFKKQEVG